MVLFSYCNFVQEGQREYSRQLQRYVFTECFRQNLHKYNNEEGYFLYKPVQ